MTRQEAIRHIVDLAKHLDKIDEELEAEKLLAALGRLISEPDPDTGLVDIDGDDAMLTYSDPAIASVEAYEDAWDYPTPEQQKRFSGLLEDDA